MRFPSTFGFAPSVADRARQAGRTDTGHPMLDIVFLAGAIAFFGLAAAYATLCERL
ncbi:hypothetical protein GPNCGGLF_LOCUS3126 [Methylorubrum aminovorans]